MDSACAGSSASARRSVACIKAAPCAAASLMQARYKAWYCGCDELPLMAAALLGTLWVPACAGTLQYAHPRSARMSLLQRFIPDPVRACTFLAQALLLVRLVFLVVAVEEDPFAFVF